MSRKTLDELQSLLNIMAPAAGLDKLVMNFHHPLLKCWANETTNQLARTCGPARVQATLF